MALRNLDGDGNVDLITLSTQNAQIYVCKGRGDGIFTAATAFATALNPEDMALIDINGDNIPDVISINPSSQSGSVLLGLGTGAFQTRTDYPLGITSAGLAVGFTITANADIVLTVPANNTVAILPNLGSGTFGGAVNVSVGSSPLNVAVADLTNDGLGDIVLGHSGEKSMGVVKNLGGGTFPPIQKYATIDNITGLAVAQLGGTSAQDILAYSKWTATSYLFENAGDGILDALSPMQSARTHLRIQYFDGAFDVFSGRTYAAYGSVHAAVADFDQDGYQDIFVQGYNADHYLILGSPNGQLGAPIAILNEGGSFAITGPVAADFDGDGCPDLAVVNTGLRTVSVYLHGAPGPFNSAVQFPVGNTPKNMVSADINNDGYTDLAVVNQDSASVGILLGRGDGAFVSAPAVTVGVSNNQGGTFTAGPTAYKILNAVQMLAADVNGDGRPDLVARSQVNSAMVVYLNGGGATFATPKPYAAGSAAPNAFVPADLNGDGKIEFVVVNNNTGKVTTLMQDGCF